MAEVAPGSQLSSRRSSRLLTRTWRTLAVFGPATMLLLVGFLTYVSMQRTHAERAAARHMDAVFASLDSLYTDLLDAETAQRGYVITGGPGYLDFYGRSTQQMDSDIGAINELIRGSDEQGRIDSVKSLVADKRAQMANTINVRREHGLDSAAVVIRADSSKRTMDALRGLLAQIVSAEHRVSAQRIGLVEKGAELTELVLGVASALAIITALILNGVLTRHAVVEATAARDLAAQALRLETQQRELEQQTEQLQSEKEAREAALRAAEEARKDAQKADATKTQFLTAMSHELRTPVNAILGFVELLNLGLAGPLTDAQRDHLSRIAKSGIALRELINDLLDLGRIEAGRLQFRLERVPVFHILDGAKEMVNSMFESKGMAVVWPTVDRQLTVYADPARVQQILINVLTNAYKYSDTGARVTIECAGAAVVDSDGDFGDGARGPEMVSIRIGDTGRGIAPEHMSSIFEPFVQLDRRAAQTTKQGVGLGLPISRTLARGMGGDLTVESELGRGSTFTLTLPATGTAHVTTDAALTPTAVAGS